MNFSFQTVCIAFVVALAHLVVLATISPTGDSEPGNISEFKTVPLANEEVESFPVKGEIPLTAAPGGGEIPEETEVDESEAVSIPRAERVKPPKPADLADVSSENKKSVSEPERSQAVADGPHEIRQIAPKPRS